MPTVDEYVKHLYNRSGELEGVFVTAELWQRIRDRVQPIINNAMEQLLPPPEFKEPMDDWKLLLNHWDFKYPVDTDVHCDHCGNHTENWKEDDPRRFRLKAANLGGLVTYECLQCKSKIAKKHFKKHIDSKTIPYRDVKSMI
jgi:hypothetical protein